MTGQRGPHPYRGFADPELLAVAEQVWDMPVGTSVDAGDGPEPVRIYEVFAAEDLERLLSRVRSTLDAVRAQRADALAQVEVRSFERENPFRLPADPR